MNKQLLGAPCPECGEPVKAIFDAFETARHEMFHDYNEETCSVDNDLYRAWAAAIKNGEREEMQLTADFVKESLAEYSRRAGEILDKPRSENDGAQLLKMRRKWLIETLLEFGNCFMPRDN